MNNSDKYIGERFEDRDRRSGGRVIRVLEKGRFGRYKALVEVHPTNPAAVGRHVRVTAKTLDRRYERISH